VVWEVLSVLAFEGEVLVFELIEGGLGQKFHFLSPNNGYSHVFTRVGDDRAGDEVRICHDEALLI